MKDLATRPLPLVPSPTGLHPVRGDSSFSYTRQENPTGSAVLDFSVWYCLSGTELPVCQFYAYGTRKIIYYLLFDLDRFISVSGGLL